MKLEQIRRSLTDVTLAIDSEQWRDTLIALWRRLIADQDNLREIMSDPINLPILAGQLRLLLAPDDEPALTKAYPQGLLHQLRSQRVDAALESQTARGVHTGQHSGRASRS